VSNLVVDTEEGPYLVHLMRDSQGAHEVLEMAQELIRLSSCWLRWYIDRPSARS